MVSGIYQIENQANRKHYIGSTVNLQMRWQQHLSALRHEQHRNAYLQAAFNKYGEKAFIFSVLEHTEVKSLLEREQHYLDTRAPEYNILPIAGSSLGIRHTPEARANMSAAKRGERHPLYGKHHSDKTRARMSAAWTAERRQAQSDRQRGIPRSAKTRAQISESHRGKHHSAKTREKMRAVWTTERRQRQSKAMKAMIGDRNPNYGKQRSEEHCRKLSAALMGHPVSAETRAKIGEAHKGKRLSAETLAKISGERNHNYGKPLSAETRAKMSAAQKARWRKRRSGR